MIQDVKWSFSLKINATSRIAREIQYSNRLYLFIATQSIINSN